MFCVDNLIIIGIKLPFFKFIMNLHPPEKTFYKTLHICHKMAKYKACQVCPQIDNPYY